MAEPPLFAGSILGLRTWSVRIARDGDLRLCASYGDVLWESGGRWTEARCLSGPHATGDPVPGASCSCGLYALHPHLGHAREHEQMLWESDPLSPEQDALLELEQVIGLVEASGRIEVHESGFRAERARPAVLLVGKTWSAIRRRGVERVARLHRAEVLEIGQAEELVEYCEGRGGALDPESVAKLLEPVEAARESFDEGGSGSTSLPPPPPAEPEGRARRILHGVGHAVFVGFFGLLFVLWYGMWAARGDLDCRGHPLRLGRRAIVEGAGESGAGLGRPLEMPGRRGRASETAGSGAPPADRGDQPLREGSRACDPGGRPRTEGLIDGSRGEDETAAVPLAGAVHGPRPCRVRSAPGRSRRADHLEAARRRQEGRRSADSIKVMTLPGPSRTIIVEPIKRPEHAPVQPEPEPDPAPIGA